MVHQPIINIGVIGHVSHGKSSLVHALTGQSTIRSSEEKKLNITMKLGYANFKVFKCPNCPAPKCYQSFPSDAETSLANGETSMTYFCKHCDGELVLKNHISFVDSPGHESLMVVMLSGAAIMDSAILVIAANDPVGMPQTAEHVEAAKLMGLGSKLVTVQNKVDLLTSKEQATHHYHKIKKFLKEAVGESNPIVIPISCAGNFSEAPNLDILLQYLAEKVQIPTRDLTSPPLMYVVRSFDINVPGTSVAKLFGGVAGGSLVRGVIREGMDLEVRPGIVRKLDDGSLTYSPISTKVKSLFSERNRLSYAIPGGLIAVGTTIDPQLTKRDRLVGQVIGAQGSLPPVLSALQVKFEPVKLAGNDQSDQRRLKSGEEISLAIGPMSVKASVVGTKLSVKSKKTIVIVTLKSLVCADIGDQVTISVKSSNGMRIFGYGKIHKAAEADLYQPK